MYPKIYLKAGREKSLLRKHLWVFSGAIHRMDGQPSDGEIVDVHASSGQFLARGHYAPGSIRVRVLSFEEVPFDTAFWTHIIQTALNKRRMAGLAGNSLTNGWRLIHGEGDGCPGLIIDHYDGHLVVQCHSAGVYKQSPEIMEALRNVWGKELKNLVLKTERSLNLSDPELPQPGLVFGTGEKALIHENSYKFLVDTVEGQKTGFFLDQRDNRALLASFCKNKKVMNLFGYTGGFSVYALGGGASLVDTVDVSEKAVKQAEENVALNFTDAPHRGIVADAFKFLGDLPETYDIMVLDPPAFAKHQGALSNAREAYIRLNRLAMEKIREGGIIFTFSCSQVVSRDIFRSAVFTAALQANRQVDVLGQLSQGADHPVNLYHPESEYLKGLVLYIH